MFSTIKYLVGVEFNLLELPWVQKHCAPSEVDMKMAMAAYLKTVSGPVLC